VQALNDQYKYNTINISFDGLYLEHDDLIQLHDRLSIRANSTAKEVEHLAIHGGVSQSIRILISSFSKAGVLGSNHFKRTISKLA
jgi:hypothetical protein